MTLTLMHPFLCSQYTSWWRFDFGGLSSTSDTVFQSEMNSVFFLHPNPLPHFMRDWKIYNKPLRLLSKAIFPWHISFASFFLLPNTPQPDSQVSAPDIGSTVLGNACFSICRLCSAMRYQMTGFHLDIIYLLYQYFLLKKVHQCENWRENIFWLRDNLEIIKVKSLRVKG